MEFEIQIPHPLRIIECEKTHAKEIIFRFDGKHLIYSAKAWNYTASFAAQAAGQICEKFEIPDSFSTVLTQVKEILSALAEKKR